MALLTNDAWAVIKQTSAVGFTKPSAGSGYPETFVATSAAPANQIISTTLGAYASANSDLVGYLIQVLEAENGPSSENGNPLIRQITSFSDTSSLCTIEALPWSTAVGDKFALLASPLGEFVETSGGSSTNIVSTRRTEGDDYFVGSAEQGGQYVLALAADNVALTTNALTYDFDAATDTLSTASLGANTAVGDLYQPVIWAESPDGPLTLNNARLERGSIIGQRGQLRGAAGLREVSGQKTLMFHGPGASRAGSASEWDVFLAACFSTQSAASNLTMSSSSTTTNLVTSGANVATAGRLYFAESGSACMCSAYSSPNATVTPALRTAPAVAETVYGLRQYKGADAAQYALGHIQWHGKEMKDVLVGTLPTITFEMARGDWLKMVLNFTGADGYRVHLTDANAAIARGFNPKVSTVTPQQIGCCRVNLDSVEFEARTVNIDLGLDIQPKVNLAAPNALDGVTIRDIKPTFTADLFIDSDSELAYHKFVQGQPMQLLVQCNEAVGEPGVFVFYAYEVELTGFEIGEDAGLKTAQVQGRITVDTTQTTIPQGCIGIA
jgi:hypothetical protein